MSYNKYYSSQSFSPTAPPLPTAAPTTAAQQSPPYAGRYGGSYSQPSPPPPSGYGYSANYAAPPPPSSASGYGYSQSYPPPPPSQGYGYGGYSGGYVGFPSGTPPEIVRAFEAVDRDRSGSIDEGELQSALSSGYQKFAARTVRLLMFLFKDPNNPNPSKIGPAEFSSLWNCLGQWRMMFERFDRDRSGKIDSTELKEALLSIGYAVPPSVIQILVSKYDDGGSGRGSLSFDNFVECGTIMKGLTEKFKEKDTRYTGSATLKYDEFMLMVIPFLVD